MYIPIYHMHKFTLHHDETKSDPFQSVIWDWRRSGKMKKIYNELLDLTHLPLVPHIWVGELGQHWFT